MILMSWIKSCVLLRNRLSLSQFLKYYFQIYQKKRKIKTGLII